MGFLDEWGLLLGLFLGFLSGYTAEHKLVGQGLHLLAVVLVEGYVVVANEVVALLAAGLGGLAIAVF